MLFCLEEASVFFLYISHPSILGGNPIFLNARYKKRERGEGHTKNFAKGENLYKECEI